MSDVYHVVQLLHAVLYYKYYFEKLTSLAKSAMDMNIHDFINTTLQSFFLQNDSHKILHTTLISISIQNKRVIV